MIIFYTYYAMELVKDNSKPWAHHMMNNIPCVNCSFAGREIDPEIKVKQCSACHYVCYCSLNCQKEHWRKHKKNCQHLKEHRSMLTKVYDDSGLFTDGNKWRTIACYGSKRLKAYKSCIARGEQLKVGVGCFAQIEAFAPEKFYTNLDQRGIIFHDWIYGLVHPDGASELGAWLRENGIVQIIDPLARNGALLCIMHMFGGFSKDALAGSDMYPTTPNVWDVEKKDALERNTYPEKLEDIAVIISWPDPPSEKDPVGPKLFKLYAEWGVRTLVVLKDRFDFAMSPKCDLSLYKKVFALKVFNIGDTWPPCRPTPQSKKELYLASLYRHSTQITEVWQLRQ